MQKNIIISVLVAVGLLAGGAAYKTMGEPETNTNENNQNIVSNATENSNAVAVDTNQAVDLVEHKDTRYNFSFQYPANWIVKKVDTESQSAIFDNEMMYLLQLWDGESMVASLLPEGQYDHGVTDMEIQNVVINEKKVTVYHKNNYYIYSFDEYPKDNYEFRIESNTANAANHRLLEELIHTIQFGS